MDNRTISAQGTTSTALEIHWKQWVSLIFLVAAVIAYYLPWWAGRAAALSANAYDLAEFLIPAVRGANPPMLPLFFLRGIFAIVALLFGLFAVRDSKGIRRWIAALMATIIVITMLPPSEFFLKLQWDDVNYRQQFLFALITLIILILLSVIFRKSRWLRWLQILLSVAAVGGAIAGEVLSLNYVTALKVEAPIGIGFIAFVICIIIHGVLVMFSPVGWKRLE